MSKLENRQQLQAARALYAKSLAAEQRKILVCAGTGCISSGALLIYDRLKTLIEKQGFLCEVELAEEPHDNSIGLKRAAATVFARWARCCASSPRAICIPK